MPLIQCKQHFGAMDASLRTGVKAMMQEHIAKYGLVLLLNLHLVYH